jgi:hypothetical protein
VSVLVSKRRTVWERDGQMCHYCGKPLTFDECTVDHVWPLALGGVDANWNLVAACKPCNGELDDRTDKCPCALCIDAASRAVHTRRDVRPIATAAELAGWRRTKDGWERIHQRLA